MIPLNSNNSRRGASIRRIRPSDDIPKSSRYEDLAMNMHITSLQFLKRLQCHFPIFSDESILDYDSYSIKSVNLFIFIPVSIGYVSLLVCRCGLISFEGISFEGPGDLVGLRLAALLSSFLCFIFFSLYCTVHFLQLTQRDQITRLKKWLPFRLEELIIFTGVGVYSLFLIARVMKGQCEAGTTVWQQQTCNPFASNSGGGIPNELVYPLYMLPLTAQLVFKNISIRALSVSYVIILAVVAFCVFYSKSNDYFVLVNLLFFINITFEITRLQRVNFMEMLRVKKKQILVLEQLKQEQVTQETVRAQELLLHRAEDEKLLKEQEAIQLRSLMGNVAHDLKTPLFAIEADIDTLKLHYSYLNVDAVRDATVQLRERSNRDEDENDDIDPVAIFESLWATIRFMLAAINRGQDYMKASNNVALVPANGTFEFAKTLSMAYRCVRPTIPTGRHLNMHPLPTDLCPMVISDSHWLLENLLCLTSNAIKYSDSGDIDVVVSMEPNPTTTSTHVRVHQRVSVQSLAVSTPRSILETGVINRRLSATALPPLSPRSVQSDISIIVTIEDHGVGVPEEMRETLFQPFRQAQRMTGGTGLGLYSLFKRVEALGGDCGVKERSDGTPGSAFWFSFPYRPDPNAVVPSSSSRDASLINYNLTFNSRDPSVSNSGRVSVPLLNGSARRRSGAGIGSMLTDFPTDNGGIEVRPALRPVDDDHFAPSRSVVPTNGSTVRAPAFNPTDSSTPNFIDVVTYQNALALSPLLTANVPVPVSESSSPFIPRNDRPNDGAYRVLLTDDTLTILKVCKRMLQTNGHAVQTAVNGHQSLEKLKTSYTNNTCDVLLTDLQMPVMDGIECTKRFRAFEETQQCLLDDQGLPRRPRFLIVGMSANSDAQSKQEALDAGMDYFCPKPFNYEEFGTIIATHIKRFATVNSL